MKKIVKPAILLTIALLFIMIVLPYILTEIFLPEKKNTPSDISSGYANLKLPDKISVYRTSSGNVDSIPLEEYVKGVVSCEMPASFPNEALKAQSVAARTYAIAKVIDSNSNGNPAAHPTAPVCDSTHCQVFKTKKELTDIKGISRMLGEWKKISKAVDETKNELLFYNGNLVRQPLFHSSSGGKTESSENVFTSAVPYLTSVDSPYENKATHKNDINSFNIEDLTDKLTLKYPDIYWGTVSPYNVKILSRTESGRVDTINVGNAIISGRQFREALNLPSSNFEINIEGNTISITSKGSGHGVGLSQYGAAGMAEKGFDYKKILSHYYSGTEVLSCL